MELRRRSSTPQDAASRAPHFGNSLRIAPRETSGTEGSNPSSSSGESENFRFLSRRRYRTVPRSQPRWTGQGPMYSVGPPSTASIKRPVSAHGSAKDECLLVRDLGLRSAGDSFEGSRRAVSGCEWKIQSAARPTLSRQEVRH